MRKDGNDLYYEVGDILYYPYYDYQNKSFFIEKLEIESIDNGIAILNDSKYYKQKRISPQYTPYSNLFLTKKEALTYIKKTL